MNFNGIFDALNYTHNPLYDKEFTEFVLSQIDEVELHTAEETRAWVIEKLENEFMHSVVRGMREFLKSPFTS